MRGNGRIFKRTNSAFLWIAYCHRGKEIRESSSSSERKDAERLLKRRLKEIGADSLGLRAFVGPQQDRVTVSELLDALEQDYRLRGGRALPQFLSHLKPIREYFGDKKAVNLSSEIIGRYMQEQLSGAETVNTEGKRSKGKRPATINRETAILRQALRLAVRQRKLSAAPEVRRLGENNARQGFFERADFDQVAATLPEHLQGFAQFGYLSGWRKGEIQSLMWTDVDREGRVVRLRPENSKNGQGRVLVLEGELWTLVERQWQAREHKRPDGTIAFSLHVFHREGAPVGDFRKAWASACKTAEVAGRLFHDLRRTAVRNMIRAGVPERVAMAVSGHKTRAIFDRYNIVSEDDLRHAMQKTQAYLTRTLAKPSVVSITQAKAEASR